MGSSAGLQATAVCSPRQHRELDMHGFIGSIELPDGAGDLWPLLAAGFWIHAGKGTVFGLGQMQAIPNTCPIA